jgi:hypothetical protein
MIWSRVVMAIGSIMFDTIAIMPVVSEVFLLLLHGHARTTRSAKPHLQHYILPRT